MIIASSSEHEALSEKHDPDPAPSAVRPYDLSERELKVLYYLAEGLADKEIAVQLGVTAFTVNKHVGSILLKMNVRSRTAAAVRAVREQILILMVCSSVMSLTYVYHAALI